MNLGINIVETNGKATPSIVGAATSVAGILVSSVRGVPGAVRMVTSFAQYMDYFGGFSATSVGAYAMKGFFDNGGALAYVTRVVSGTTAPVAATTNINDSGGHTSFTVTAAYLGANDPGVWANGAAVGTTPNGAGLWVKIEFPYTGNLATYFRLTVLFNNKVVEVWEKLKVNGLPAESPTTLNDENQGSHYISISVPATAPEPAATANYQALAGGTETAPIGSDIVGTLPIFNTFNIQLLAALDVADADAPAVYNQALLYAAGRGDCTVVGHVPSNQTGTSNVVSWVNGANLRGDKVYGALYYPYIKVVDPLATSRWVPPTGHVLGIYARTDRNRGIWKAPAGNEANVMGALDVKVPIGDVDLTVLARDGGVNGIRAFPGAGIIVDSSRTLSTNTLWLYVGVRLLFNYVKSSLKTGLRWTVQEPNDARLWGRVKHNSITPFLMDLWRRGAFGPGSADQVFSVKVDADNNPSNLIQQGILTIEVYFYPSRPAETIVITVGQQDGGATVSGA